MLKPSFHKLNRENLSNSLANNSVLFLQSKDVILKGDSEFFDFCDVNMFYLTGIEQAETKLLIYKNSKGESEDILFVQNKNNQLEMWNGARLSSSQAKKISGIKNVYYNSSFEEISQSYLSKAKILYYYEDKSLDLKNKSEYILTYEKLKRKNKLKSENIYDLISSLRKIKTKDEIDEIREAMKITRLTLIDIMKNLSKFKSEKGIEASLSYSYIGNNCNHSYQPIVASGINACTLHYVKNNSQLKKGDLVLIDTGAEHNNYKTDITRTLPISGRFSKRQKEIYESVLKVQKQAIKMLKPSLNIYDWDRKVLDLMAKELIKLKLITKIQFEKDRKVVKKFYPHSIGHFLGLDTHDIGSYKLNPVFSEGIVFTVEPGIYVPKEKIGVRIEDNVLITKNGCEVLSKSIPKEVKEIERLFR